MGTLPLHPEPSFFQGLELAASMAPHFISKVYTNLQHFAMLLDNNITVAMQYLKTMTILKISVKKNRLT